MERAGEVRWTSQGEEVFTGWCGPWWPARRFVIVEAVPAGDGRAAGWDWAAWIGDGSGRSVSGTAATLGRAMKEAEWAAGQLPPEGLQAAAAVPM